MIITSIEKQKKNSGRFSVFLDDKFAFAIDEYNLFKLKLKEGMCLSEEELLKIKETVIFSSAKDYAMWLISRFSYTKKTIKEKLKSRQYDDEIIEKTIEFLENYNFLDDVDFARRFIIDSFTIKHHGIKKIKYELIQKGIDESTINEALEEIDADDLEFEGILQLATKKLSGNFEYKNIMKVKRFLVSKGYSYDLIDSTINSILREKGE